MKPILKNISNTTWRIKGRNYLDDWPIDLVKRHWKNKFLIVSSWWQKAYFLLSCQCHFARLSLVRITPFPRYQQKTLIFKGIFNFQSFLLLWYGMSGWIKALCMELIENFPLSWSFQPNSLGPSCSWTLAKGGSKAFQNASLGSNKSLVNVIFGGEDSIRVAIISFLWWTIHGILFSKSGIT
jgi:hypothetical protein